MSSDSEKEVNTKFFEFGQPKQSFGIANLEVLGNMTINEIAKTFNTSIVLEKKDGDIKDGWYAGNLENFFPNRNDPKGDPKDDRKLYWYNRGDMQMTIDHDGKPVPFPE